MTGAAHPNEPNILIRPEQPAFVESIAEVHRLAFGQDDEAEMVAAVCQSSHFDPKLSLMALYEGQVVGHVLFSPVTIAGHEELRALGLAPLGVLPDFQGQFIGSALVYEGLEVCRRKKIEAVFVLGHPEYYSRFGFAPASRWGIGNIYGVDEPFMVLELASGALEGVRGVARYLPMFEES